MTRRIGIIAEDDSDVAVVKILIRKLTTKRFAISHFIGKGCGSLKRKAMAWCRALAMKGCTAAVVVHDQDRNDVIHLRSELERAVVDSPISTFVVIPIEELEAWLLADCGAIERAMNLARTPRQNHNPESIPSPKEHLGKVIEQCSRGGRKRYVNTVHNEIIAGHLSVQQVASRCSSFRDLKKFVRQVL